ncbi:MAG TPA: hypothetical protein VF950_23475 [Planctomycetota bacterium]
MSGSLAFPDGGYRFVRGASPYSAGVVADPGFAIERVRFAAPVPLAEGFRRIEARLLGAGRPKAALCACELRSPRPFTMDGFVGFNKGYVDVLKSWGLFKVDGLNPVARSNVCPELDPPAEPSFFAFCYTVPGPGRSFVVAGSGEVPEEKGAYPGRIVRRGDVSPDGLREKARWVMGEMERRMSLLGVGWRDATAAQVYTPHPMPVEELKPAFGPGLTWHFARPPIVELDFEMDCRATPREIVL